MPTAEWMVAFDPDTHHLGCAAWNGRATWKAETRRINGKNTTLLHRIDRAVAEATDFIRSVSSGPDRIGAIILERPEVQGVHRIGALVPLAFLSGSLYGHMRREFPAARVIPVAPAEWKNPIPKHVFERRLQKAHPQHYRKLLALHIDNHAFDAVGLILNHVTGEKL